MHNFLTTTLALCCAAVACTSHAQPVPLTDEPSRSDLARYAMSKDAKRAFPRSFEFPRHAVAGKVFGIDVSHHQGKLNWSNIAGQGIRFAYVKASQGERYFDAEFARNWEMLDGLAEGAQPIRRGAYHFMSASGDPKKQADNFLQTIGKLKPSDLPPCLDIEWDFPIRDRKLVEEDQWEKLTADEIVNRIATWISQVELATGKKPIIYTNASWWKQRVGSDQRLTSHKLWIADYTSSSLNLEKPRVPPSFSWSFWQITDKGNISKAGLVSGLDVNVFRGGEREFHTLTSETKKEVSPAAKRDPK